MPRYLFTGILFLLEIYPENGWSLFGLVQALRAQGKSAEDVDVRLKEAWKWAGIKLTGSRF